MRLQKQLSRKAQEKEYAKWVIVIPPSTIKKLGWKEGQELGETMDRNHLILMPMAKGKTKSSKAVAKD